MTLQPLGDQAILAYFPSEAAAVAWGKAVRAAAPAWLHDVVVAYSSAGLFFDADAVRLADVLTWCRAFAPAAATTVTPGRRFTVPVCYERQLDLDRVAEFTGLTRDAVIATHLARPYTVYAIGFVPGFPYLGYLPPELAGVPRLASPRLRVEPGSVGLTGRQTGIYPLARPGGWNVVGRTPLTLVDPADGYFPLAVGDAVSFARIDEAEYARLVGTRLTG